jgi:hypothetical protein
MTEKTYLHAGYSELKGEYRARFANDALRVKVLEKGGATDIQLTQFITPLSKIDAVAKLLEIGFADNNPRAKAALESYLHKHTTSVKPVPAPKAITIEGIRARVEAATDVEQQPF